MGCYPVLLLEGTTSPPLQRCSHSEAASALAQHLQHSTSRHWQRIWPPSLPLSCPQCSVPIPPLPGVHQLEQPIGAQRPLPPPVPHHVAPPLCALLHPQQAGQWGGHPPLQGQNLQLHDVKLQPAAVPHRLQLREHEEAKTRRRRGS